MCSDLCVLFLFPLNFFLFILVSEFIVRDVPEKPDVVGTLLSALILTNLILTVIL